MNLLLPNEAARNSDILNDFLMVMLVILWIIVILVSQRLDFEAVNHIRAPISDRHSEVVPKFLTNAPDVIGPPLLKDPPYGENGGS